PAQVAPFHEPPVQEAPFDSRAASAAVSTGLPKMSRSPSSAVTRETTTVPREPCRVPVPRDQVKSWSGWNHARPVNVARYASATPVPYLVVGGCQSVLVSRPLTSSGSRLGRLCSMSATTPDVSAAACEVPLPRKNRLP